MKNPVFCFALLVFLVSGYTLSSCHSSLDKKAATNPGAELFESLPPERTGIYFQNTLKPDFDLNILEYDYYYNGGGAAAADFNNDGLTDLYFTGNQTSSRLYLNRGDFKFEDVTEKAGVQTTNWATGVAVTDVNNDGLPDIYVCYAGYKDPEKRRHQLFINQGVDKNGVPHFKEMAREYGLDDTSYSTQAVFFDYDKDGDLDLFLLNHDRSKFNPNYPKQKLNDGSGASTGKLFRNDTKNGKIHFTDVSKQAGIKYEGYGLGIAIADINQDGWPDIYVANDFAFDDLLYINNKDGSFTESLQKYVAHTSRFSMGCDIADYNNDGLPDIVEMDMLPDSNERQKLMNLAINNYIFQYSLHAGYTPQYSRNMLQLNNGPDGKGNYSFSEIGQLAGIYQTDWSWSPLLIDLDNDGWKDLFITNGIPKDITNSDFTSYRDVAIQNNSDYNSLKKDLLEQVEKLIPVEKSNFIFKNNGDLTFSDSSIAWGMTKKGFSNGAVYADLDNDGDLDLVTNNINAPASVYRNRSEQLVRNNYLRVKLKGKFSCGAKVIIHNRGKGQYSENNVYRGFQSTQEDIIHFGLGKDSIIDTLEVIWLDGKTQLLKNIRANQVLTLEYKNAEKQADLKSREVTSKPPLFTDITDISGINFVHHENQFEDFDHEPLLPHRYSRNGPYIAVGDVDGNGLEDFWVGGPAKIPGKLFLQQPGGRFISKDMPDSGFEDMGGVLFDADGDGDLDLYVVSGGNEYNPLSAPYQDRLYINDGKGNFSRKMDALPVEYSSGSCVMANDFDKDGDMDLFVGGRIVPNSYPMAANSFILRNNGKGKFEDATDEICPELKGIGLVTSAIWTDFDNDGWTDLIVVGEWMNVTFFKNVNGKLKKINQSPQISNQTGWWFSIAAGDFDNDGDIDYIVGNLGLNNKFKPSVSNPVSVYAKDFTGNGVIEPILTDYLNGREFTIANRDQIASVIPTIKKRFDTYTKFAAADFEQLFPKEDLSGALVLHATSFASVYLENKGHGQFEMYDLPLEAQFSTIQSMQVQDFDNDGNLDILIGGNFYSPGFMIGRYDASIGLLLKGDGHGHFKPVSAAQSGIHFTGDVRSMAPIRIGKDKAIIIAVNSGKLMVYKLNEK